MSAQLEPTGNVYEFEGDQLTFTITLPKNRQKFKLRNATQLLTDKELHDEMLVSGSFSGTVKGFEVKPDRKTGKRMMIWTVEVLEAELG